MEIGSGSLEDYESIEVNNVDAVESVVFGSRCFRHTPSIELNELNGLNLECLDSEKENGW